MISKPELSEPVAWEPFQSLKIKDKPFLSAQHETTPQCWCNPEVDYVDPDTGVTVYVHKEIQ